MNRRRALRLLGCWPGMILAQGQMTTFDELVGAGRQWFEDNVADRLPNTLGELDEARAKSLL